jgi:hypothetical protein
VAHEISEVMGRELWGGGTIAGTRAYSALDLFHYSASGVRDLVGTQAGYFSVDGGTTNLNSFNTNSGGDYGDWAGGTNDAFNAFGGSGVIMPVSAADLTELDAIGFDAARSVTGPQISSVTATAGDYNSGQVLTLTLAMSAAVNVTGSPTLTLNDGGTATYLSGAGTNALTFTYTVGAGQNTAGLAVTAVNGTIADLSGNPLRTSNLPETFAGVIIDAAGNAANMSGALATFSNLAIDPPLVATYGLDRRFAVERRPRRRDYDHADTQSDERGNGRGRRADPFSQ